MSKKLSVILLALVVCSFLFVGCAKSDLEGSTWKLTTASSDGVEVSADLIGEMSFEFKSGDKVAFTAMGETAEGTYKEKSKEVDVTIEGDTLTLKIDGKKMSMEQDGMAMTFEKQ